MLYHVRMTDLLADPPLSADADLPFLAGLNEAQCRAVAAVDGPVLVLAGAGTGKTRVLTTRLAHILASRRAFPGEILAVTFTNKAAREMRERLEAMIGRAADGVWLGTFHAIAARILRRHAETVGLLTLFGANPEILASYQRRFRYLLVDEYQDTNVAQYLWLRLLAQQHRNLCCVGDDDQSIYSWRGAEIGNILKFESDFPGALIVRLEENYRSTPEILAAAAGVIAHNRGRLGKTLWTRADAGDKITVRGLWDAEQEARWVGDEIEALQHRRHLLKEIAILVRAGFQTREFEERFIALALPYRVIGGPRFYERQEIRDALAYLRLVRQPSDDLAFERVINVPRRGIGTASLQQLHAAARVDSLPLIEAARRLIAGDRLPKAARNSLAGFIAALDRWRADVDRVSHTDLVQSVLDESGYTAMWQADRSPDAPGRLENLKELVVAMAEFENLGGFLEHVSLVMDNAADSAGDMVNLMTLHSAKGLEFDTVFLPGWEEGLFPSLRSVEEHGLKGLEEERRLAYVGLTRARHRIFVSFAANRRIHGQWQSAARSRFVDELSPDHVEIITELGLGLGPAFGSGTASTGWTAASPAANSTWGAAWSQSRMGRAGRQPLLIESARVPLRGQEIRKVGGFAVGDRVFHQKFGYGTVQRVEDNKLAINFEHAGEKKVMDAFVERA